MCSSDLLTLTIAFDDDAVPPAIERVFVKDTLVSEISALLEDVWAGNSDGPDKRDLHVCSTGKGEFKFALHPVSDEGNTDTSTTLAEGRIWIE